MGSLAALAVLAQAAAAGDLRFQKHVLNEQSEFLAAAAIDVNQDGNLDIVCGSFWYEAPDWTRRDVRETEIINGRPDGYAHLPLDVNGDGRTDVITVNFRSRSIKWLQNPGPDGGEWVAHVAAEPGSMESGRLVDIDNDGQADVLPAGSGFAAWWSFETFNPGTDAAVVNWTRHELPDGVGGHGIGSGDINGDGRIDVLGPNGWAEAPENAREGAWRFHSDFNLGSVSVPVLVGDVDGDGDADLVFCEGHDFGAYWMERSQTAGGDDVWERHTIDSSWSGGHAPQWADMDGDGRMEMVVGKRYLPHEGRDPGEYDPMVGYRYQFDPETRTWNRWALTYNEGVPFGLDPKVIDLDGDGDMDMLCASRGGLFWLENLGPGSSDNQAPPAYEDRADLMVYADATGAMKPVEGPFDWGQRRAHTMASIEQAIGELPESHDRAVLDISWGGQEPREGYTVRPLNFALNLEGDRGAARLYLPAPLEGNASAVIYLAANPSEADALAEKIVRAGFACLVVEAPQGAGQFGEKQRQEIWQAIRAIDLLESLPEIQRQQVTIIGDGERATAALLTAAFDQRLVSVMAGLDNDPAAAGDLATLGASQAELLATIAPRPMFLAVPEQLTSRVDSAVSAANTVYELRNGSDAVRIEQLAGDADGIPAELQEEAVSWITDSGLSSGGRGGFRRGGRGGRGGVRGRGGRGGGRRGGGQGFRGGRGRGPAQDEASEDQPED